ncbi:hypothetical protein SAMN05660349_03267, partial [Macellibacteroides fermentans]
MKRASMKLNVLIAISSAILVSCQSSTSVKSNDVEKRVEALLSQMTLEEK